MITLRNLVMIVVTAAILISSISPAQEPRSLVGQKMIVRRAGVQADTVSRGGVRLGTIVIKEIVVQVMSDDRSGLVVWADGKFCVVHRGDLFTLTKAEDAFSEAIRNDPKNVAALTRRAAARSAKGEADKALADIEAVIRLDGTNAFAFEVRGFLHAERQKFTEAIADYDTAVRLDPDKPRVYTARGAVWEKLKENEKAIADFTRAAKLDATDALPLAYRGLIFHRAGQYAKAEEDYTAALKCENKIWRAYQLRAWLRATCPDAAWRDGEKAVADATKACELTDWKNPISLSALAAACAENGQFDDAVKWEKKALEDPAYKEGRRLKLYEAKTPYRETRK